MGKLTCKGCKYEDVDLRSKAVSNCVGCKRIYDGGKKDNYKSK